MNLFVVAVDIIRALEIKESLQTGESMKQYHGQASSVSTLESFFFLKVPCDR